MSVHAVASKSENAPKVSVALATYNGARFLAAQLESIANQTLQPFELVVTDDNSTDETLEVVERFSRGCPFEVIFKKNEERLGYQRNFMGAAGLCRGDYVAFCDQDDIWSPNKLEYLVDRLERTGAAMAHHNARLVDGEGQLLGLVAEPGAHPAFIPAMEGNPWQYPMGFTQVFRRDLMAFSNVYPDTAVFSGDGKPLPHDQWIGFLAFSLGGVAYVDETLVDYRQHGANVYGYGNKSNVSLYERLRRKFSRRAEQFPRMARFCRGYSQILAQARPQDSRSPSLSELYLELGELYEARVDCYEADGAGKRLKGLLNLLGRGGYGSSLSWTFGWRGLLRDLSMGVVGAPVVRRFGRGDFWGDPVKRVRR